MKKIFTLIVCLCMAFALSACSQDHSEEEARAVVDKYYTALNDGDWEKAQKLYAKEVDDGNELNSVTSSMKQIDSSVDSMGLNASQRQKLQDIVTKFMKSSISLYAQSYKITKASKNDKSTKVVVTVEVKGYDPNDFLGINMSPVYRELTEKYKAQVNDDGSNSNDVMIAMMSEMFDRYSEKVKDLDTKTHKERLTLVKSSNDDDASWKIKKIKVFRSTSDDDDETDA